MERVQKKAVGIIKIQEALFNERDEKLKLRSLFKRKLKYYLVCESLFQSCGEKSLVDVWQVWTRRIQTISKTWLVISKNNSQLWNFTYRSTHWFSITYVSVSEVFLKHEITPSTSSWRTSCIAEWFLHVCEKVLSILLLLRAHHCSVCQDALPLRYVKEVWKISLGRYWGFVLICLFVTFLFYAVPFL